MTEDIKKRIKDVEEIRSGHELYQDDVSLTVTFDHLNEPQAIALLAMFETWETHGRWGASRMVSFFVDGDGPFNPEIQVDVDDAVLQAQEFKDVAEYETNKFDPGPVTGKFIDHALEVNDD